MTDQLDLKVEKIKTDNDFASITIGNDELQTRYRITLLDYYESGLRLGQMISAAQKAFLEERHCYCYAYEKCIRKLSAGDKTEREIRDLLMHVDGLGEVACQEIIDQLKAIGYLSDESVIESQLYLDQYKLIGKKKTRYNLQKRGIDKDTINTMLGEVKEEDELERGLKKAKQLLSRVKNKSFREAVQYLRTQLSASGFENTDEIISALKLKKDDQSEDDNLKKQTEKCLNRYRNRYQGKELYRAVYQYLLSKGFESDAIKQNIEFLEEENEN